MPTQESAELNIDKTMQKVRKEITRRKECGTGTVTQAIHSQPLYENIINPDIRRSRMVQSLLTLVIYNKPSLAGWLSRGLSNTPAQIYANAFDHPNQGTGK